MEALVKQKYEEWLNSEFIEEKDKEELRAIAGDEKEITERFYKALDFGTGGLRGVRGIGTNMINVYVIRQATQGLANYMLASGMNAEEKGIVIAYDSRIMSTEFAENAALVMAANGIKAYLFDSLRPTPELSFAVRELGALAGIVVTASHNPPEYNGYKVYWDDGAQVVAPHDKSIIEEVYKITDLSQVKFMEMDAAKASGKLEMIGKEIDDKFIAALKKQVLNQDAINEMSDMSIVFTPLHGTGNVPVQRILKEVGFNNVHVVKEQEQPDGNFPTVGYPNPEAPEVFEMGIKLAEEKGSKLVLANDPDADRIGIAIKSESGEWMYPNGNQVGLLLSEYIMANKKPLPENGVIITTIVSTPMLDAICKGHGVGLIRTLTGFKYIGEKIKQFESGELDHTYLFGFEESYGYLAGTHARDKDAIVATMLIVEMAAYFETKGSSIEAELEKMYEKYGFYREGIEAVTMKGKEGAEKIVEIMDTLRKNTPSEIVGTKVTTVKDFKLQVEKDMVSGEEKAIDLPESNVLQIILEDDTHITARPSGTEPKIKFYFGINAPTADAADEKLKNVMEKFLKNVL